MAGSPTLVLLLVTIILFLSILFSKTGYKFGVPTLLFFLLVGMVIGKDGLGIEFDNANTAQVIGMLALCVILFSGGMDTKYEEIKPIFWQGVTLATLGVIVNAFITGGFIWLITNRTPICKHIPFTFPESMLLASIMASTDSASVFAILRSKSLKLKHNLRPTLELESGSNDPMAYLLTIIFIQIVVGSGDLSGWSIIGSFFYQFAVGAVLGFILGKVCVVIINKINLNTDGLYMVLMLIFTFFIFSITDVIKANGYLAVYVAGLVIGNSKFLFKNSILKFYDGLTWLFQLVLFIMLGLFVNPSELPGVIGIGLLIAFFMIIVARPAMVFLCLLPFKYFRPREKLYISWVGLRGAVPIIFATYPLVANVPVAHVFFNIVFLITIVSLLIQGTSVPLVAKWLKLSEKVPPIQRSKFGLEIDFNEDVKSAMSEVVITEESLRFGKKIMNIPIPEKTLVVMVRRGENYFIPKGNSELELGDILLVITDDEEALKQTYKELGVNGYKVK